NPLRCHSSPVSQQTLLIPQSPKAIHAMKNSFGSPQWIPALLFGSLLCLALSQDGLAQRSVTIPARSASTLDNNVVPVEAPDVVAPVVPLSSPFDGKSSVSRVAVPESRPGGGQVATQTTRVADPAM